ncbi:hypothetical protein L1987_37574 [Smallanthus sonchifolius]|uniref:Uncharacterized protein n=1 Tax=Smallanthus sonchifolius TaxID=185202 RepID=A0ACB9HGA9_9ASTR|nr:hypothetical protein L1987_37574 [Smallanthus sonchifolius]
MNGCQWRNFMLSFQQILVHWSKIYSWIQRPKDYSRFDDDYVPMEDLANNNSLTDVQLGIYFSLDCS